MSGIQNSWSNADWKKGDRLIVTYQNLNHRPAVGRTGIYQGQNGRHFGSAALVLMDDTKKVEEVGFLHFKKLS